VVPIMILSGSAPQARKGRKPPDAKPKLAPTNAEFFRNVLRVIFLAMIPPSVNESDDG
jgi:hypothetical protein